MTGDGPFAPVRILDFDARKLPSADIALGQTSTGQSYGGAYCLIRTGPVPIGIVELDCPGGTLDLATLTEKVRVILADLEPRQQRPSGAARFASIVVATRERPESLARCLSSLIVQDWPDFEIIVVDNAPSSTATADLVRSKFGGSPNIRYVREDQPGLGRAHNAGIEAARAKAIAFTDDDVIADAHWLSSLVSNFDAAGKTGCVTGLILPAELETRAQMWTERHGGFGKGFRRKIFDLDENRPDGPLFPYTAGQFGSGANMAFSRDALRVIGGFDPALGAGTLARGGDDLAGFHAVIKSGFKVVYEPEALIWHHHRRSEDGMQRQAFGYGMGLGAYLTKLVTDDPSALLHLALRLPAGLAHMGGRRSAKSMRLPADYPKSLVWRERLGILAGVPGYIRSMRAVRRPKLVPVSAEASGYRPD